MRQDDEHREARRRELQAILDAPCPSNPVAGGSHDDPDNSGLCVRCECVIDIMDEDLDTPLERPVLAPHERE